MNSSITFTFKALSEKLMETEDKYNVKNLVPWLTDECGLDEAKVASVLSNVQKSFVSLFKATIKKCQNKRDRFFEETKFLGRKLVVNFEKSANVSGEKKGKKGRPKKTIAKKSIAKTSSNAGRKRKAYEESSLRTKRRRVAEVRKTIAPELLKKAAKPLMQKDVIKVRYTKNEALALFIEAKLTKDSYNAIKRCADFKFKKEQGTGGLYPGYDYILAAKGECYPEKIEVTEKGAKVTMQSLLNHTAERILKIKSAIGDLDDYEGGPLNLTMLSKYGFDGATGQAIYKQKFVEEDMDDSSIIMSCMVPLRITQTDQVFWENKLPSSPNLCRPLKFFFARETEALTTQIVSELDEEVANLVPYNTVVNDIEITVSFEMVFTMVDGKVGLTYLTY